MTDATVPEYAKLNADSTIDGTTAHNFPRQGATVEEQRIIELERRLKLLWGWSSGPMPDGVETDWFDENGEVK